MSGPGFADVRRAALRARELEGGAREAFLASLDPALRAEVESLVSAESSAPQLLDTGALADGLGARLAEAVAPVAGTGLPERIGPYRIVERLGEGGMGEVYRARLDEPVQRDVALKVVRRGLDSDRIVSRFEAERRAIGMMSHPGIARIFDAGAHDGLPYFVMEIVDGRPVTEFCDARRMPAHARLELFLSVCDAVQHAHRRGIVHRDLKPSNILVAELNGEPLPKVIDFGIAKALEASPGDDTLTGQEQRIGTPEYMSPEQAGAIEAPVDERADVYSLGVVLHELLVGWRPREFRDAAPLEMLRILRDTDPDRPSTGIRAAREKDPGGGAEHPSLDAVSEARGCTPDMLERQLSGDLDDILLMALRRDPARRYESVAALASDIGRYLAGDVIRARDAGDALPQAPNNLPRSLTRLVGREDEVRECRAMLESNRLVTLTGAGGSGKTRLAVHVARWCLDRFTDGIWFVGLAPITVDAQVMSALAGAVGAGESPGKSLDEALATFFGERRSLIVLDNCEHVLRGAADIVRLLLKTTPNVCVLATSREALGLDGEHHYLVPVLPADAAVELFADRAAMAVSGFSLSDGDRPVVQEICRHLDGIPLAIELAAARVKVLSLAQLLDRLDDRFRLLTSGRSDAPPRQQTLLATIQWSFDLLDEPEKRVLRALSVFSGGWTLESAHAVADPERDEFDVLELHSRLVDKSLVMLRRSAGGESRFQMLETVSAFAAGQLAAEGEDGVVRMRHLDYFVELCDGARERFRSSPELAARLEQEHDNLLAAIDWAKPNAPRKALQMVAELGNFWWSRGYLQVGRQAAKEVLALEANQARDAYRARVLHAFGALSYFSGDIETARRVLEESLGIWNELGMREPSGPVLSGLGSIAHAQGDEKASREFFMRLLALGRDFDQPHGTGVALTNLGNLDRMDGDFDEAIHRFEEAVGIWRRVGDRLQLGSTLNNMATLHLQRDEPDAARHFAAESLEATREVGARIIQADALDRAGAIAADLNAVELAVRCYGAARALRELGVAKREPTDVPVHEQRETRLENALGRDRFESLIAQGEAYEAVTDEAIAWLRKQDGA